MTEDEAKTKWCPFTRLATKQHNAFNRVAPDSLDDPPMISAACLCIGSACMAWRETKAVFFIQEQRFAKEGDTYQKEDVEMRVKGGFCGLAIRCGLGPPP